MKTLFLLCVLAAVPVACRPCDLDSAAPADAAKKSILRIVLGEGGGIAGTWKGYTITGDGVVYAWSGRGARENELEAGRLPADTMCVLWDAVKTLSGAPPADSSGSLVRFLSVTTQDSTRKYSWRPKLGTSLPRTVYQEMYDRCNATIRTAMTQTDALPIPSK